jgi:hypothetical protein
MGIIFSLSLGFYVWDVYEILRGEGSFKFDESGRFRLLQKVWAAIDADAM